MRATDFDETKQQLPSLPLQQLPQKIRLQQLQVSQQGTQEEMHVSTEPKVLQEIQPKQVRRREQKQEQFEDEEFHQRVKQELERQQQQQRREQEGETPTSSQQDDPTYKLDYFENLRINATNVERIGNLDVITTDDGGNEIGFCHLVHMVPLTWIETDEGSTTSGTRARTRIRKQTLNWQSSEQVAAMYIALRQLNTGDGSVVPAVQGLNERCNIRFTAEIIDTELSEVTAVNQLLELVKREAHRGDDRLPCAFLGASRSAVSIPTSIITGILGYPQFSSVSTSSALNDKLQYRLFGRTVPSDDGTSIPAIDYFRNQLQVTHLCVLYVNDSYGAEYARSLQRTAARLAPDMKIVPVEIPASNASPEDFELAVSLLAETEFRYIFAIIFGEQQYNELMTIAYEHGIAGPGYTWIFADATSPADITDQNFEFGSPLHIASQGTAVLQSEGGVPGRIGYDKFAKVYQEIQKHPEDISFIESQMPLYQDDDTYQYTPLDNLLAKNRLPPAAVSFIYDATIALGLAACNVSIAANNKISELSSSVAWEGGGEAHYFATVNADPFQGASGNVSFLPDTGGRDPNSALFQLTNMVANDALDPTTGLVSFRAVPSVQFESGKWETLTPHIFSDGTTTAPPDLPKLKTDLMQIGLALRIAGLGLSLIGMSMAVGFSYWTFNNRFGKVVQISQPIFLHIICFGNFLMASAIIPLSFDDELLSRRGCSNACIVTYWLFWMGFAIAFSALFSKTWRLNQIFYNEEMRRKKVLVKEVVLPMFILILMNVLVLSIWTAISPMEWQRKIVQLDKFGRISASRGKCTSEFNLLFQILMGFVNATALIIALYQVYRARHISNEFGEAKSIAAAIAGMFLVSIVGVPVIILEADNPRANFFVLSVVIFAICALFLLLIYVPKLRFHRQVMSGTKSMRSVVRKFSIASASVHQQRSDVYEEELNDLASVCSRSSMRKLYSGNSYDGDLNSSAHSRTSRRKSFSTCSDDSSNLHKVGYKNFYKPSKMMEVLDTEPSQELFVTSDDSIDTSVTSNHKRRRKRRLNRSPVPFSEDHSSGNSFGPPDEPEVRTVTKAKQTSNGKDTRNGLKYLATNAAGLREESAATLPMHHSYRKPFEQLAAIPSVSNMHEKTSEFSLQSVSQRTITDTIEEEQSLELTETA